MIPTTITIPDHMSQIHFATMYPLLLGNECGSYIKVAFCYVMTTLFKLFLFTRNKENVVKQNL